MWLRCGTLAESLLLPSCTQKVSSAVQIYGGGKETLCLVGKPDRATSTQQVDISYIILYALGRLDCKQWQQNLIASVHLICIVCWLQLFKLKIKYTTIYTLKPLILVLPFSLIYHEFDLRSFPLLFHYFIILAPSYLLTNYWFCTFTVTCQSPFWSLLVYPV